MNTRKISRRDMLRLSGALAGSALLAACAQPTPAAEPAAVSTTLSPTADSVEPTSAPAPAAAQRVEVWTGFGQGRMADAMTGAVKKFNEQQTQFVAEHIIVPWGDIRNKVVAATAAKSPPDVYRGWAWIVGDDAPLGGLTDLTPYVEADSSFNPDDFWPGTLEQMRYQGKYYAVSISTMVQMLYYNKDRMKEKNISIDTVPDNLEDWEAIGEQLYELSGNSIDKVGFCPWIPDTFIWGWAATRNIPVWDAEQGKCVANNAQMVEMFNWYKGYAKKYGTEELQAFASSYSGNSYGRNTPDGVYYTGRLAVWALETWLYNDMKEYGPTVDFGITKVPSPKGTNGKPAAAQANMYLIPAGCKVPAGGFAFGNFMASDPWVALNKAVPDSVCPSRKSNATNADVEKAAPWIPMVREIIADAWPVPSMPASGGYLTNLTDALNRVLWEDADPQVALDDAVKATQIDVDKALKQG